MNKNFKKMLKYSKFLALLFLIPAFILLIYPLFMVFSSASYPLSDLIIFITFSIITFISAYILYNFLETWIKNNGWLSEKIFFHSSKVSIVFGCCFIIFLVIFKFLFFPEYLFTLLYIVFFIFGFIYLPINIFRVYFIYYLNFCV